MAASSGATALLPPVKSVVVYRNGDPFYCGRRFVVNQRQVATMEAFLNEVTQSIGAPLAVRGLYTPRQGHRVTDLQDLQTGHQYVAAGFERFKKLDYLNTGMKKQPVAREGIQARIIQRPNVSAKWRKFIPVPCIIHVFRNGDLLCPPFRFIIPRSMQRDLEQILSLVTEKVSLRTGAVRRLCTLEGVTVSSAGELETGHCYVAVGTEKFKKLPYVELLISKATERYYPGKRRQPRRTENRKAGSGPEDRYSDSALLDSPESDGRRVKSTGDEAAEVAAPQATQRRTRREEESSVFYARPVKIRKDRGQPRPPISNRPSVFKRGARKRREEVRGAEEVQEDDNTATELPVDQRVADIVEDEGLNERDDYLHNTEQQNNGKARTPTSSPVNSKPIPVQKGDSISHSIESDTEASMTQTEIMKSEVHNERNHPDRYNGKQAQSSEQDDMEQQTVRETQNTSVATVQNSAGAEEDCASAAVIVEPEPKLASSNSRASSSTSHSSGASGRIQGKNKEFQGERATLQSSNPKKGSPQDPPPIIVEQSNCQQGLVAEENGGFIKEVTSSQ